MSFRIIGGKGFHMTFDNNVTVSVQFGPGNYCDNYDADIIDFYTNPIRTKKNVESKTAEVAIFRKDGDWLTEEFNGDDQVSGYQSIDDVMRALEWARNYKEAEQG